ncbi:helix-turn-helix domain-containing protein [Nostoc parmelioides]|uniref:Helix-turn-helix domain-containing protein n=1 Tax=Nostoc parmelioides FACHB-3921 TaxID=2692909 RepID=A0ABR8BMN1_9NOSO|nr:helix-turn-helix domain-containing protein [Nostoc parmelioides FACHB-3921]
MKARYRYRIYPTDAQQLLLSKTKLIILHC